MVPRVSLTRDGRKESKSESYTFLKHRGFRGRKSYYILSIRQRKICCLQQRLARVRLGVEGLDGYYIRVRGSCSGVYTHYYVALARCQYGWMYTPHFDVKSRHVDFNWLLPPTDSVCCTVYFRLLFSWVPPPADRFDDNSNGHRRTNNVINSETLRTRRFLWTNPKRNFKENYFESFKTIS